MFDYTPYDAVYYSRRTSAQAKCVNIIGDDGHGCLDAPEQIPAGSTRRLEMEDPYLPFAATRTVLRDGYRPSIHQ